MIFFQKILHAFANMRLALKFSIIMVAIILIMAIISISIIETKLTQALHKEFDARGMSIARGIAANALEPSLTENLVSLQLLLKNTQKGEDELAYAFIIDDHYNVLAHTFEGGFPTDLLQVSNQSAEGTENHHVISTESGIIHDLSVPILAGEIGYVHVGLSLQSVQKRVNSAEQTLFIISFIITVLTIAFSFLVARFITKPLVALATAAEKLGGGDLNCRVKFLGKDEIGTTATVFNAMAETIKKDIEKQAQLTASLRKSETLYRSLVENIDLGVSLIDNNHNILMVNSAQGRMFNKPVQEFTGKKCFTEFEKRTDICPHCPGVRAIKNGRPSEVITEGIRDDGSHLTVKIKAFPVINKKGEVDGFIEVVEDITDSKRLMEEVEKAQKLESIGLLAGGIAHDFNNLLTAVVGNISLSRLTKESKKQNELLKKAEEACCRAQSLTQQLLTFSRGGSPVQAPHPVQQVIQESADFSLRGSNSIIEYNFAHDLKYVNIDADQIKQVVQNLVINANQAMPGGGKITISAVNEVVIDSQILTPGEYVKVKVHDTGGGIPEEFIKQIFDPYFTTKATGTGLGLAVSYSVIKKHGGIISVNSNPDNGTVFTFYLPVVEGRRVSSHDNDKEDIINGTGNVLIIDDDQNVGETLVNFLDELGYEPYYVTVGEEAIRLLKEKEVHFDIVITDLTIPGSMGGVEIKDYIRQICPDMKIVVMSGYSNDPVMAKYSEYGFDGIIKKPFRINTVAKILHKVTQ